MGKPRVGCLLVATLLASGPAAALTDEEIFRDFKFNLINPGARSLALAGAFVSLADDATAARANPAGLTFLEREEYFLELRGTDNAARSSIRTETLPAGIETFVATGTDLDDEQASTFLSYVLPFESWTLGVSIERLIDSRNATLSSFAFTFPNSPGAFLAEGAGFIDVEAINYNLSAGYRVNDDLRVGLTVTGSRLEVKSEVENFIVDIGPNIADREILEPTLDLRTSIRDQDEDLTFSLGLLYKPEGARWSVGAVYRRGADFTLTERIDPGQDLDGDGLLDVGLDTFNVRDPAPDGSGLGLGTRFGNRFSLPDSYGAGASWNPSDNLTLALDVERILYSNLLDGYVAGVNILTAEDAEFTIDDATEVRAGAEYLLFPKFIRALALRGGVFTEEDSTIRARSTGTESFATPDVFAGRDTVIHGALGVGLIWERFKLDLAVDFSDNDNEYLVSIIYKGKN